MIIEDEWSLIGEGREGKRVVNYEKERKKDMTCYYDNACKRLVTVTAWIFTRGN